MKKIEIAFAWRNGDNPDFNKIFKGVKEIHKKTGAFPKHYKIWNGFCGLILSTEKYTDKEEINRLWWNLVRKQNDPILEIYR